MPKRKQNLTLEGLQAHVSESVRKLNPHLFGPVARLPEPKPKRRTGRAAKGTNSDEKAGGNTVQGRRGRPVVILTSYRVRLIDDDDNLRGGFKWLRDRVAEYIGLDDSDSDIEWRYYQVKVQHFNEQGTSVIIQI